MELVEVRSELHSNKEVLCHIKEYSSSKQTNLATILYETTVYLESSAVTDYSALQLTQFLDAIKKYELTRLEKVQLVNLKPQNNTELHLIIDNIEDRFDEGQKNEILKLIESFLGQNLDDKVKKPKT